MVVVAVHWDTIRFQKVLLGAVVVFIGNCYMVKGGGFRHCAFIRYKNVFRVYAVGFFPYGA